MSFITIELENESHTFSPGEKVYGKVVVQKRRRGKNVKCIVVQFEGGGIVSIVDHLSEHRVTSIENCLNTSICICGEENAASNLVRIRPGRNEFSFEYILPQNLPTSFLGKYGSVSYQIRATIWKSKKTYATTRIPFILKGILDLNNDSLARKSCEVRRESKLWSMCMCHNGKIKLYFAVPRQGYTPGEIVPFYVEVSNFTFNHLRMVKMSLIQVIFYIIEGKRRKTQTRIVADVRGPEISPGKVQVWKGEDGENAMKIPDPCLPTKLCTCSIIQVHYQLQIKVRVSNMKSNDNSGILEAFLPLIIGTVPLEDYLLPTARPSPSPETYSDFAYMDDDIGDDKIMMKTSIDKYSA